jgi:acetoin utilization deacetylase AcuC-like enzyme
MGHNAGDQGAAPRDSSTAGASDAHLRPQLALVDDPLFDEHWSARAFGHPERPERLTASRAGLSSLELGHPNSRVLRLPTRDATPDELSLVHEAEYVEALDTVRGQDGYFDADTYYGARSVPAALRAAGGALELVDTLVRGDVRHGLALLRPPGHHARPSGAMGFCLVNNAALAAARALALGVRRVAIVDYDVHHGNGTEEIFYADPRVLYVSLHQYPFYPGTGAAGDAGEGEGRGYNVNVPLSAGATPDVYREAFDAVVTPVVSEYAPELLLISAGYDAHQRDPLGGMHLDDASYAEMTRSLLRAAGAAPVGVLLEGGYDLRALQGAVAATGAALLGTAPEEPSIADVPARPLDPRHAADIERVRHAQRAYRRL